jgi:cardiolipin synthase
MPLIATGSGEQQPKESRRWLKSRVPSDQLYRLAPARQKPKRFNTEDGWSRGRSILRAWWIWLGVALLTLHLGHWAVAAVSGILSFVFYHTSPVSHPAIRALVPVFGTKSENFRATIAGVTGTPLVEGNRVAIFQNGDEFYPQMLAAIESAQLSITMEQYIFWDGQVGRRFAEAFAEKAREGIPVKLLLDAVGSANLGRDIFRILEAGGCELAWFRPIHWYTISRANHRNHRKSLIVDGCIAFTGGAGFADHWLGEARDQSEWRDTQVKVEGPGVLSQQSGFAQNWLESTGEILSGPKFFPQVQPAGEVQVQTILSSPLGGGSAAGTMYLIALQCATDYLYIANPYFIPDTRTIAMLSAACDRQVVVKLLLSGEHNDTWWARQNSLRLYGRLLKAGVEIHEFEPTMLHQKTMVVDGEWATIGTTNFDNRSFSLNEETNVCFHDPALVDQLRLSFLDDLTRSHPAVLTDWQRRGLWQRSKEWFASLIEDQV